MSIRRTARLLTRLVLATTLTLAAFALMLAVSPRAGGFTTLRAAATASIGSGVAATIFAAGLLALLGQLGCLAMLRARMAGRSGAWVKRLQGSFVPLLAGLAGTVAWLLRPTAVQAAPQDSFILAAILLLLAFLALIAERIVAAIRPTALPEAASLRTLMMLPVLALGLSACVAIASAAGFAWAAWIASAVCVALILVALELGLRALALWFLPPPPVATARAAIDSLIADLLAGSVSRGGIAAPIRSKFGIDFSRSWALQFLRAATLPALVLTALLCWGLSGLVMVDLDQRGVYQRFGAPAGVLQPGLHLILPWPLGATRRVELGIVHEIAIGGEPAAVLAAEKTDAEAPPPPSASRLWGQPHPGEVTTLIASETAETTGVRQSFQAVNADIRVLTRIGLTDQDAVRAATFIIDPDALVRRIAGRRVARFFAVRTLAAILGERREAIAEELRAAIAADLAPFASGVEVVGVSVEAIHPPAGAAAAYHAVQAAAIASRTAVAEAQGRATAAGNEARQQTHQLANSALAQAAETVQTADADRVRFTADQSAHAAGGQAFLLDRYFADLVSGFAKTPLTIVDHRLAGPTAPVIDLRPLAAPGTPPADDPD